MRACISERRRVLQFHCLCLHPATSRTARRRIPDFAKALVRGSTARSTSALPGLMIYEVSQIIDDRDCVPRRERRCEHKVRVTSRMPNRSLSPAVRSRFLRFRLSRLLSQLGQSCRFDHDSFDELYRQEMESRDHM